MSRTEAIERMRRGHAAVRELWEGLSREAQLRPGLGGGDWSAKDLLGHLTSWEEHALAAMEAWASGQPAPIDRALRRDGLDAVNLAAVETKSALTLEDIEEAFEAVHEQLTRRIAGLSDEAWALPPTARFKRSLGERLGSLLVGASGPFGHADSHLPDLLALREE